MKKIFAQYTKRKMALPVLVAFVSLFAFPALRVSAQGDSAAQKTDSAAPAAEMISPSLEFVAVQKGDNTIDLKAHLKGKVNGRAINFYELKIGFFRVVNGEDIPLGFLITDGRGKATLTVKADTLNTDAEGKLHFKAAFSGNKAMDAVEEVADFKKASLKITPVKEDSTLSVQVKLSGAGNDTGSAIKDVVVGIYVKRSFFPLKVGEGTTDENGEATIEFPNGLPGNANGELTILGRVDENETFGNLEDSSVQKWGVPVNGKIELAQRALWSTHPPIWMLITFIVLMTTVWGHYIVIVYELFRLRKEEPHNTAGATNP